MSLPTCTNAIALLVVSACAAISAMRAAALVQYYGAPLALYAELSTTSAPATVPTMGAGRSRSPSLSTTSPLTRLVCVGKEWYRFPSSFFLPADARLEFIQDGFDVRRPARTEEQRDAPSSCKRGPNQPSHPPTLEIYHQTL